MADVKLVGREEGKVEFCVVLVFDVLISAVTFFFWVLVIKCATVHNDHQMITIILTGEKKQTS